VCGQPTGRHHDIKPEVVAVMLVRIPALGYNQANGQEPLRIAEAVEHDQAQAPPVTSPPPPPPPPSIGQTRSGSRTAQSIATRALRPIMISPTASSPVKE